LYDALPVVGTGQLPELGEHLPPEMLQNVRAYLATKQEVLPLVEKAAQIENCFYDVNLREGVSVLLPHLSELRQLARVLKLRSLEAAEDGQGAEAAHAASLIFRTGRGLRDEPILISLLVRIAIDSIAGDALTRVLSLTALPEEAITELDAALAAEEDLDHYARTMRTEAAFVVHAVGLLTSGGGSWDETASIIGQQGDSPVAMGLLAKFCRGMIKDGAVRCLEAISEVIQHSSQLPPHGALEQIGYVTAQLEHDLSNHCILLAPKYAFPETMVATLERPYQQHLRGIARLACARTALRIESYRNAEGQLPESLGALGADRLEGISPDPFSGDPVKYRKAEKGYLVYSVGLDGRDNGGHVDPDRQWSMDDGTDIVFRVVR